MSLRAQRCADFKRTRVYSEIKTYIFAVNLEKGEQIDHLNLNKDTK